MLNKLQVLAKLNEDLKDFNPDYQYTKHLIENNIRRVAKRGQEVNVEKEYNIIHTEHELEKRKKARLTSSRWLSDWTLECEFLDVNGETFTKIYQEDDFFATRQEEREQKIKASKYFEDKAFTIFWWLNPTGYNKEKEKAFDCLRATA